MNKIEELLRLKLTLPKVKNGLTRKTQKLEIVDYANTIFEDDSLVSQNSDTNITLKLSAPARYLKIVSNISAQNQNAQTQVFYKSEDEEFSEQNSIKFAVNHTSIQYIVSGKPITHLRLDAINTEGKFDINYFEILKISKSEYKLAQRLNTIKKIKAKIKQEPTLVKKFIKEIKNNNLKIALYKTRQKLKEELINNSEHSDVDFMNVITKLTPYKSWQNVNQLSDNRIKYLNQNLDNCQYKPLISIIIPVYNPPLQFFKKAIQSVQNQIYKNFEICIVDDCSTNTFVRPYLENLQNQYKNVKIAYNDLNSHISITTNNAVNLANGEYLVFLDQDDELTFDALAEIVLYLNKHTNCDLLYSDDDKIDTNAHCFDPQFKPDWSPEYLLSFMYCGHLKCVSKELYLNVGGFRKGYEGSQDYDFYLRASEKAKMVGHIPRILYHWRVIPGSTAAGGNEKNYSFEAGLKAVQDALIRRNIQGKVYHPKWALNNGNGIYAIKFPDTGKSVGIIIPTKNGYDLLKRCVESLKITTYKNYKIYIIDNESDEQKTINYLKNLNQCEILRIPSKNGKFSFSYINNEAVKFVKEELVLFLNNDTEVINERWLSQMVGYMQFEGVGSVGARLLFPDNRIQHAGIIHGITNGFPITSGRLLADWEWGYLASTVTSKNFTAVTAACMLTTKELFEEVGGFDDIEFSVAFNDCDYGYKLHQKGLRNVLAPEAKLYHYEGASREHGDKPSEESSYIKKYGKWKDSFYNLNLANNSSNYAIASKSVVLHSIPKFRVLMVTHNLNLEGAPKSFYEIVKGIKKIGLIEPVVVSHVDGPLRKMYDEIGVEVNILKNFNLFSMTNEKEISSFIDEKVKLIKSLNVELIYGNTIEAFWAIHCAKKINLPCVWNIRESEEPFSSYNHNLLIKKYMINAMAYPYKIVFVANATQVVYEPLNTQNNFMTIYNGFDEELAKNKTLNYSRETLRKELNIGKNELSVLILGTVCERKGQKDLVEAIALMSDDTTKKMKFLIVGDRKSLDYSKEMHNLINSFSNDKQSRITVVDETPEIHKYYTASDIFVCSSRVESFPKVIQEAMYYKLAIITTPVYGIVEQVKNNISALYYQPGDIKTLSKHLDTLAHDEVLRNKISTNAKTALGIFPNINEMASQYEEVFKEAWLSGMCR
ncbi:glycosyltransferase [Aliarcobacter butzleri]|uniref:glycosyltransferase n=1 Tax=Aliarcobacter butzleri TaxID=28197 RepID=UPI00125F9B3D|nr:glycosyltransferase [Aliarcobacter butzleri]MDK2047653.1 glycosyltransferase [Aliarcobacter butzleri]